MNIKYHIVPIPDEIELTVFITILRVRNRSTSYVLEHAGVILALAVKNGDWIEVNYARTHS